MQNCPLSPFSLGAPEGASPPLRKKHKLGKFPEKRFYLGKNTTPHASTLFLDLDDTLVLVAPLKTLSGQSTELGSQPYLGVKGYSQDGASESLEVFLRPGVREFLERAAKHFELIIFTAAKPSYADPIIERLDEGKGLFSHRLYRHHCTKYVLSKGSEVFVKELAAIGGRELERCILLDDQRMHVHANEGRVM